MSDKWTNTRTVKYYTNTTSVKYYMTTYNTDQTEGRGSRVDTGIAFLDKTEALRFVQSGYYRRNYGIMGTPGGEYDIREVKTTIYKSYEDFMKVGLPEIREKRKQELLSKMSPEDRALFE